MEENEILSNASFWLPRSQGQASRWAEHIPFAFWLVKAVKPATIVQLGARPGDAYFAFCEAVQRTAIGAQCRAVDTRKNEPGFMAVCEEVDRRLFENDNQPYRDFSVLISKPFEEAHACFTNLTIDLLHVHAPPDPETALRYLESWQPSMSERGVVLLDGVIDNDRQRSPSPLVPALARRYPAFEFRHGGGLAVIAVGTRIPEKLARLLNSLASDPIREEFEHCYERLGRGLREKQVRLEADQIRKAWDRESAESSAKLFEARAALDSLRIQKSELDRTRETVNRTQGVVDQLLLENATLFREGLNLEHRLSAIETSLGWLFMLRLRRLRAKIFRPGTVSGRCWTLFSRFLKTAGTAGIRVAIRKVRERVVRKLNKYRRGPGFLGTRFLGRVFPYEVPADRFLDLPWKFLGPDRHSTPGTAGSIEILLVSHAACRTGAPLCLLRLAEELSRLPDVACWVVLQQGGELADAFARTVPTLEVEWLVALGINRHDAPAVIASSFHQFSSRGIAVCNTLAVRDFHAAFAQEQVDVLSWIHELPTFIELLGGDRAIEGLKRASRKIMVPSEAVRVALTSRFGIDADRIRTVYNGQDPLTKGLDRLAARLEVRRELGLPEDARIVLGCGTVDLRKGADLFVNVARRVLQVSTAEGESPLTWFVWAGHLNDDEFRRWLFHDCRIGGLGDRIRFIGPRSSMAPYYMAADLLALTSREDPCPLVNMEAMEAGLAVVAFDGAGGAPEVLGDAGLCVPYLDAGAMAAAVRLLLADARLRHEMGTRGRARIRGRFSWLRFMEDFREILGADFERRPAQRLKVSVIVPNYRHARFLEERLQSIFDQTRRPHEIIFLDDASPDDSVRVARRMARHAPAPMQIVVNDQNSGSTFKQWLKGMSLATGDLIWLAESDDAAHPLFLERMVPEFFDPEVVLAYCQSALIGPRGERLADNFLAHTDDISSTRWRGRFSTRAAMEAELALSQKNTIPNASAVVFRRPDTDLDFAQELTTLKFAGDWFFYSMLIRGGKINYLPEVLNVYRRHQETVSHRSVRGDTQAQESLYVKARVFETYPVTPTAIAGSLARSVLEYEQLTERMNLERPALSANAHLAGTLGRIRAEFERRLIDPSAQRILVVLSDIEATAETLAGIELASALARENTVFVCNAQPHRFDLSLGSRLDPRLILLEGTLGPTPWSSEDDLGAVSGAGAPGRRALVLRELIRLLRIDVVHTHAFPADRLVLELESGRPIDQIAATRTEAGLEARNRLAFTRKRDPDGPDADEQLAFSRRRPA